MWGPWHFGVALEAGEPAACSRQTPLLRLTKIVHEIGLRLNHCAVALYEDGVRCLPPDEGEQHDEILLTSVLTAALSYMVIARVTPTLTCAWRYPLPTPAPTAMAEPRPMG